MDTYVHALPVVFYALVVCLRWPMVRSGKPSASLWTATLLLTLALSVGVGPVGHLLGEATTGRLRAEAAKLCLLVGAAAAVKVHTDFVAGRPTRAAVRDVATGVGVVAAVLVALVVAPPATLSPLLERAGSVTFYDRTWRSLLVWSTLGAYLGWISVDGARFSLSQAAEATGPTRTALWLATLGFSAGCAFVIEKLVVTTIWQVGSPTVGLLRADNLWASALEVTVAALLSLASSWVGILRHCRRLSWTLWAELNTTRLRPLWRAVTAEHPGLRLPVDRRHQLRRMVIEIRDGLLALAETTDQATVEDARGWIGPVCGHDPDATLTAAVICAAQAGLAGRSLPDRPAVLPLGASSDLRSEVAWLVSVAGQYRRLRHRRLFSPRPQPTRSQL